MNISLKLTDEDTDLIKSYVNSHGISMSEFFIRSAIEHIEDEYDLEEYNRAMEEYRKNPITYSHEEVAKLIDLD